MDYGPYKLAPLVQDTVSKNIGFHPKRSNPSNDVIIAFKCFHKTAFILERMITDIAIITFKCFHKIWHNRFQVFSQDCLHFREDDHWQSLSSVSTRSTTVGTLKTFILPTSLIWLSTIASTLRFLEKALLNINIYERLTSWVLSRLCSFWYSVKCNGEILWSLPSFERSLAGRPSQTYLFLFIADNLTCILDREIEGGNINPIKVARSSPHISNILFVDDILLF